MNDFGMGKEVEWLMATREELRERISAPVVKNIQAAFKAALRGEYISMQLAHYCPHADANACKECHAIAKRALPEEFNLLGGNSGKRRTDSGAPPTYKGRPLRWCQMCMFTATFGEAAEEYGDDHHRPFCPWCWPATVKSCARCGQSMADLHHYNVSPRFIYATQCGRCHPLCSFCMIPHKEATECKYHGLTKFKANLNTQDILHRNYDFTLGNHVKPGELYPSRVKKPAPQVPNVGLGVYFHRDLARQLHPETMQTFHDLCEETCGNDGFLILVGPLGFTYIPDNLVMWSAIYGAASRRDPQGRQLGTVLTNAQSDFIRHVRNVSSNRLAIDPGAFQRQKMRWLGQTPSALGFQPTLYTLHIGVQAGAKVNQDSIFRLFTTAVTDQVRREHERLNEDVVAAARQVREQMVPRRRAMPAVPGGGLLEENAARRWLRLQNMAPPGMVRAEADPTRFVALDDEGGDE